MSELAIPKYVFDDAPLNVYWETTIACSLACQHCRAAAIPQRDPDELTTDEGCRLIDEVGQMGSLLILTGGDPLERPDLVDLVAYARSRHVSVAVTPSTTPSLKRETVARLKELGITALGVSLDGPTPEVHDAFRGVAGTFIHSQSALAWAREFGVTVQINSTVTQFTRPHLDAMFELLVRNSPPVRRWSLFLLIPTGRGLNLTALNAHQVEELFEWTYEVSEHAPFHISTVEAPHYRRYWIERKLAEGRMEAELARLAPRMGFGIRDGNGVIFVARNGDVFPAGFLPYPPLGNVRRTALSDLYRRSPDLMALRDMDALEGRCGRCRYRWVCGGSRARAWAVSGRLRGEDPACAYQPPAVAESPWPGFPLSVTRSGGARGHGHPPGLPNVSS
jgi:radical SAM protein